MSMFRTFSPALNLELHDGGDASPLEDLIILFVQGPFSSRSRITVQFRSTVSSSARATYLVPIESRRQPASTLGLASLLEVQNTVPDLLGRDRFASVSDEERLNLAIAEKTWIIPVADWQFLAIPKRAFTRFGGFVWSSVNQFGYLNNGVPTGTYCVSDVLLVGGGKDNGGGTVTPPGANGEASNGGLQGTYKYKLTYLNSETGNRSNGTATAQVAENVNRGYVTLTGIPTSADSQVTDVEVWRTVGGGIDFFKIGQVTNGTTTFDDEVSDHPSLDSTDNTAVMSTIVLPDDNDVPSSTFDGCIIDKLTAFWITNATGQQGRVFFSPPGRPEGQKGFLNVSQAGDPLHKLVVWNSQRYVFSEAKCYRIDGDDPYTGREIGGVPGVQFAQRRTVVPTPIGIIYQAADGVRAFNGSQSVLLGFNALGRIFRGETAEGLPAFEGIVATFARGEYYISDGTRTLAFNVSDLGWRDTGFNDISALFFEWDTDTIVGGRVSNTQLLEEEGAVTDAAAAIPFEWETPAVDQPNDQLLLVQRVFVDIDANSQTVTAALVHRFGTETLGAISDASRVTTEFELRKLFLKPSLRFSGSATDRVTLFDAELDVQPLVLEVRILEGSTASYQARYREGLSTNGSIVFTIDPSSDQSSNFFDQTNRLFVLDRLTIETDTASQNMAVQLTVENTTVNLGNVNTATRSVAVFDLDRVGPLNELRLDGPFFSVTNEAQVYRVVMHVRELSLGLRLGPDRGRRVDLPARSTAPTSQVQFEVPPPFRAFDDFTGITLIDRILYDINTGGVSVTPTLRLNGGAASITPGAVSTASRANVEQLIDRMGALQQVELAANFIANEIGLFTVEVVYLPIELGIKRIDGQPLAGNSARLAVPGRAPNPDTEIVFEVQPVIQVMNQQDGLFWIDRMVIEADTNGTNVAVSIDIGATSSISIGTVNTSDRRYTEFSVQRATPIRDVRLTADFTTAIRVYGIELYVRPVQLGLKNNDGGSRGTVTGRMVDGFTELLLTVNPEQRALDGQVGVSIVRYLYLDIDTDGTDVTPQIDTGISTVNLTVANTSSRETVVYEIHEVADLKQLTLSGDFLDNAIGLYGVELAIDQLELGIQVLTGT